jgi:hypothetical protein
VLTYTQVLFRSLKISAGLLFVDLLIAFLLRGVINPFETFGDMLLVETASLFLLAGFVDFGTSVGFVQFRKFVFASKETFSSEKRKEAERRAMGLVGSGLILLSILIALAKIS